MKNVIRIILTFLSVVSSYYFIFWVPFSLIPGAHNIPAIPIIVSLLIALTIGFFVWKKTGKGTVSNGLLKYIIIGGIIIGSIGLILGVLGPIILNPSGNNNQAPLLGILITGPIGFIIGLVGGGIYWRIKVKKE